MKATSLFAGAALLLVITLLGSCRNQAIAAFVAGGRPMTPIRVAEYSARDFDFLAGNWQVVNRRLKARHVKSNDWDEFPGHATMRPILRGLGNLDEVGEQPRRPHAGTGLRQLPRKRG